MIDRNATNSTATWVKSAGLIAAAAFLFLCNVIPVSRAQQTSVALETVQLRPNFFMFAGAGANIAVQTGSDGVVLVDAGTNQASERVLEQIRKLTAQPIRYIIDTGPDAEHVSGNAALSRAGKSIFAAGTTPLAGEVARSDGTGAYSAYILASDKVLQRMSAPAGKSAAFPSDAWPSHVFDEPRSYIYFNGEAIEMLHQPAAHSDGDLLVFFRASDVIAAGEIIDATRFPVIDIEKGGSIQGEIDALNRILSIAVRPAPFAYQEGGTFIIPAHGHVYRQIDVVEYRDMLVIIRDTIQNMIHQGKSLQQIKEANPARAYEPEYGSQSGMWTTDNFIEAIYKSLTKKSDGTSH